MTRAPAVGTLAMARLRPEQVLALDRKAAIKMASQVGVLKMQKVLRRAQAELNQRLRQAEELSAEAGQTTFTEAQVRVALAQVREVTRFVQGGMRSVVVDQGDLSAKLAATNTVKYMKAADQRFRGVGTQPIALDEAMMLDRAARGAHSSILHRLLSDPENPARRGILERYGDGVVQRFEETLQVRFVARTPWEQVKQQLVAESPFLQEVPGHWAERIVRTEVMAAHGASSWEAMREADQQLDGTVCKILCATFDTRTGSDSYAVHGQIRRVDEAFESWFGLYMHPPNRPNDREVVVPHRTTWPIPASLEPRSDADVLARWRQEKRKGSPPTRPKMSTVPRDIFGTQRAA